ncbi:unnamed protein product [Porites lobata]|uniref:Ig-like domain-containing protein n=1 Tax=Porites lobata TaxID=104759 RepID=A0ABN8MSV8_9CNID|nr:unnamed protein product [Porites lobata]
MSLMSLLLNCKPVMNIAFNLQTTFLLIMLFSAFVKAHGLAFDSEPNITTIAATGSNQTFTWKLSLREKDKSKQLQVQFGPWDRKYKIVKSFFMTVKQEPSEENETVARANQSTARRLHWKGDLSRDYYIAFKLVNIQRKDAGDYGMRLRVDHFPPTILQNWFSLIVQDPTPTPYIDTRHITLDVIEGDDVNITCRTSVEARSYVMWFKDKVPIYAEQSKFLSLTNVNRLQGGNYSCVSINQAGNTTSPITTINVLYTSTVPSTVPRPVTNGEKDVSKQSKTKGFKVINVLIPLLVIFLLFVLIIVVFICLKKRKIKREKLLDGTEKKNYYDNKMDKARSNLKQTWKILNEVINRRVAKSLCPGSFTKNGMEISNSKQSY